MEAAPRVAVVVVHYTGCDDTMACLESLAASDYPNALTVVVGQGGGDGAPAAVRARFPDVVVVENARNRGFSGGSNVGIAEGLRRGADYVFLLNNDATVAPDTLGRLVARAEREPTLGALGPLVLQMEAPGTIWAAGGGMDRIGRATLRRHGEPADTVVAEAVDYVVGCGLLMPRRALEAVGALDDRFFLYYEEADLCARLRAAGWGCAIEPSARIRHHGSRATGVDSPLTLYYMRRNRLLYLRERGDRRAIVGALAEDVRLLLVWSVRGDARRRVLSEAVRDFLAGRFGPSAHFSPDAA